jgi:hypothetical protein
MKLSKQAKVALVLAIFGGIVMGAALQADAYSAQCGYDDLPTIWPPEVVEFYQNPGMPAATDDQRSIVLSALSLSRRDLAPLFEELPTLLVGFDNTVGFAFATGVVLNRHDDNRENLTRLFLHELGHVWDQQITTPEERIAFMETLPWKDQLDPLTPWRSDHLPHSMRPIEAYANSFMESALPCDLLS